MKRPIYGQVVVGPPGSGKTTYCNGMQQYMRLLGRNAWVVNLDPANERISALMEEQQRNALHGTTMSQKTKDDKKDDDRILPYETIFDVCKEVVNITSVMKETGLGPNGGLVWCMEYLEQHVEEIVQRIQSRIEDSTTNNKSKEGTTASPQSASPYLVFDLPGQVELYTHSTCVQNLLQRLQKTLDLRLTAVQLIDSHYCTDASKFLSAALLGTTTMLRLELPTVNVLSKVDMLQNMFGEQLDFALDYYTECHDLERLVPFVDPSMQQRQANSSSDDMNDQDLEALDVDQEYQQAKRKRQSSPYQRKFAKLHQALAEVVGDFGLLQFTPLDISDAASVGRVLAKVDKCNGFVFTGEGNLSSDLFQCAIQQEREYEALADVKERVGAVIENSGKKTRKDETKGEHSSNNGNLT